MSENAVAIRCKSEMNRWMDSVMVVPQEQADDIEQSIKERMRGFERNGSCYGDVMREIAQAAGIESLALCDYDEDTDEPDQEPGQPGEPYTVMGESTYLPFAAEDGEEAAAGAVDEPAAEDDGADYSDIEPEEDEEETDYEPTPEEIRELEEDEELGAYYPDGNPDFATGYSFDDLKKVRRVLVSDDAGEKAEREAREVLPSVMGSDIWEAMLDEFEGARERVARLMDNHNV